MASAADHSCDTCHIMDYLYDVAASERAVLNHPLDGVPPPGTPASYWMCFGLWPELPTQPQQGPRTSFAAACQHLAERVAHLAGLQPHHRLLEVGCGAGDAMLLWLSKYGVREATGVEIVKSQQQLAHARVSAWLNTQAGVQTTSAQVLLGSATQLPMASGTQDAVLALDCAYHFNTRQAFFKESARVLVPQGRLAMVDAVWDPGAFRHRWARALFSRLLSRLFLIPQSNHGNLQHIEQQLADAGFQVTHTLDVTSRVVPGFHAYVQQHWRSLSSWSPVCLACVKSKRQSLTLRLRWLRFRLLSWLLVVLVKWRCLQFVEVVAIAGDAVS